MFVRQEVVRILGDSFPFAVSSSPLDLPELQGEPEDVSREKCKLAAGTLTTRICHHWYAFVYGAGKSLAGLLSRRLQQNRVMFLFQERSLAAIPAA